MFTGDKDIEDFTKRNKYVLNICVRKVVFLFKQ